MCVFVYLSMITEKSDKRHPITNEWFGILCSGFKFSSGLEISLIVGFRVQCLGCRFRHFKETWKRVTKEIQ